MFTHENIDIEPYLNFAAKEKDAFIRKDETNDSKFYKTDRFVHHLDSGAMNTVKKLIEQLVIENQPVILDLMSSWDSHIPDSLKPSKVIGLGLNENELMRNISLDEYILHDLNRNPILPFEDDTFDVVLNTVSVDYITKPFEVFREVGRILKPGGLFLVIFSNRYFPKKVVRIWDNFKEDERLELVKLYFKESEMFEETRVFVSMGKPRPSDDKYSPLGIPSDPIFAVYTDKKSSKNRIKMRPRPGDAIDENKINEQILKKKSQIKNTLQCPYCNEKLKKWKVPDSPFIEWGNEYLFICMNDSCPFLVKGWETMFKQGNVGISYRLMYNDQKDCTVTIPILSLNDLKDGIIEE